MSTDIKLSKAQLSKLIQSGGYLGAFLGKLAGPLINVGVPLPKMFLAPLNTMASTSVIDGAILEKMRRNVVTKAGKGIILVISDEYMDDIIRIIKSLENSSVLTDWVSETLKHEIKKKEGAGFLGMLLGTSGASMLGNVLTEKVVLRAGKYILRAGIGYKNMDQMNQSF